MRVRAILSGFFHSFVARLENNPDDESGFYPHVTRIIPAVNAFLTRRNDEWRSRSTYFLELKLCATRDGNRVLSVYFLRIITCLDFSSFRAQTGIFLDGTVITM